MFQLGELGSYIYGVKIIQTIKDMPFENTINSSQNV